MFYVYVLISEKDNLLYTGFTPNLKERLTKHKNGYVKATKHRRPVKLLYYESYFNELDARRRERYLKGGKGKSELKIQIKEALQQHKYKYV